MSPETDVTGRVWWLLAFVAVAAGAATPGIVWGDDDSKQDRSVATYPDAVPCRSMPHRFSESHDIFFDGTAGLITFSWPDGTLATLDVRDADCQPGLAAMVRAEQAMFAQIQADSCRALRALVEHLRRKHGPAVPTVTITPEDYDAAGESVPEPRRSVLGSDNFDLAGAERSVREGCPR